MELTNAQKQAIKTFIQNDPVLSAKPENSDGSWEIADILNAEASPDFWVWRRSVTTDEVGKAVNYVAVEAMTDANRNRINTFYGMNPREFDPSRTDIRSFWSNTFSGALGGQGAATRDALEALWRRKASVVEKLLASGTGSYASPATLGAEGPISYAEIDQIRFGS